MLSKTIKRVLLFVCGSFMLGCIVNLSNKLVEVRNINLDLHQKVQELAENKDQLENNILTLEQTVDNLKGMEFKFYFPTGMELGVTPTIKQDENGYYTEVVVDSVSADANMATSFEINGSWYTLDLTEFDLLARTVRAESGGMSESANIGTANVILHRIDSELYPDSVTEVVHQPHQFEVVSVGTYTKQPTAKAVSATVKAMNGVDVVPNALGFWNADTVPADHELWSYPILYKIDSHVFSRLDG